MPPQRFVFGDGSSGGGGRGGGSGGGGGIGGGQVISWGDPLLIDFPA